jgi:hypothetical protein
MTLISKQIYQQNELNSAVDQNNTYFVIDMLDPSGSGQYLTYRLTAAQCKQLFNCTCLQTVKSVFTASQISNLFTTPRPLVQAQGAGTFIQPVGYFVIYNFVSSDYTSNQSLAILLNGNASVYGNILLPNAGVNTLQTVYSGGSSPNPGVIANVENQPLMLSGVGGNPGGGNSTLTVYTTFTVITA